VDYNEVFLHCEKKRRSTEKSINTSIETISLCEIFNLVFSDDEFTRANRRHSYEFVLERLDQFCGSAEWIAVFPFFKVSYLDIELLDHVPILLGTRDNLDTSQRSRRWQRFEIVWAEDQSCEEIINSSWS